MKKNFELNFRSSWQIYIYYLVQITAGSKNQMKTKKYRQKNMRLHLKENLNTSTIKRPLCVNTVYSIWKKLLDLWTVFTM